MNKRILPIGAISAGTLLTEDLIQAFLDVASDLRLTRTERRDVREIERRVERDQFEEDDLNTLTLILEDHVPAFCQFGAHEGDGALFGVWVDWESIDAAVREGEIEKGSEFPPTFHRAPYRLVVSDHGNATLYRQAGRRWVELWGVV